MGVMTLLLGGKIFNAFVSCFVVHLSICRWLGKKKFLVKHVADKFYPKNFSFGPEKDFFIQSPTSLANDFQAVFGPDMPKAQTS